MTVVATDIEDIDKELREAVAEFQRDVGALQKQREDLEREWTRAVDEKAAKDILQNMYGTTKS
jgi:FtsZ-binding cell division protein ZapB